MNKRKCDRCDRPATNTSVELVKGEKIVKQLCELHAAEEGMVEKVGHTPLDQLLKNFVAIQSGSPVVAPKEAACGECGMTYSQFREHGLLGCPGCYKAFESQLNAVLERAQDGGTHHVGKAPRRAGNGEQRQAHLMRMRKRLADAVAAEDYKLAARLRDEINRYETQLT